MKNLNNRYWLSIILSIVGVCVTWFGTTTSQLVMWAGIGIIAARMRRFLAEQTGQQRHQGDADQRHTAACHELLHALGLCAGVVITVTFQKIDCAPDAKTGTQCDHQGLKNANCGIEKSHISEPPKIIDFEGTLSQVISEPFLRFCH